MENRKKQQVYIMLSYTGTWLSQCIKFFSGIQYPHVSVAFDKDFLELYSFGRKNPLNPLSGGFVKEDIKKGIYAYFPNTICSVYVLDVTNEEYNKMLEALEEFKKEKKKYKFNFLGLFGVTLNFPFIRENHYFCSQFVATILERGGIELFDKHSAFITSKDFIESDKLKLIYTGKFYGYNSCKVS